MNYTTCIRMASLAAGFSAAALVTQTAVGQQKYEDFDASSFSRSTTIDNAWLPMKPGTRWVWEGTSVEGGVEEAIRLEFTVTNLTKEIAGVNTVVTYELDYIDGELDEAEAAFYAQDDNGVVWHFGQYPEVYEGGQAVGKLGWLHGKNGHAGIMMTADPQVGDRQYSQGYAPDIPWTDRAKVIKTGETVRGPIPGVNYVDVVVIEESDAEEPDSFQMKYYARGTGNIKTGGRGGGQKEDLDLIRFEQLGAAKLAQMTEAASKLLTKAKVRQADVFAGEPPAQRGAGSATQGAAGSFRSSAAYPPNSPPADDEGYTMQYRLKEADFIDEGETTYYVLRPGFQLLLEGVEDGQYVTFIHSVLDETRDFFLPTVGWVKVRVIEEKEWVDGTPFETALSFYALDRNTGNLWDFGDEVFNYNEDGTKVANNLGTWHAGEPDEHGLAWPGIVMPGTFLLGARYYQQFHEYESMERAVNAEMGLTMKVKAGTFNDVIRISETNIAEPGGVPGQKWHAPGVGLIFEDALELVAFGYDIFDTETGKLKRAAKIQIAPIVDPVTAAQVAAAPPARALTDEQAKEIAMQTVRGRVTAIERERKMGKNATVVKVTKSNGDRIDVILETDSGKLLGIEDDS